MKKHWSKLLVLIAVIKWVIRRFYTKQKPAIGSLSMAAQIAANYNLLEVVTKLCNDNCYDLWQKMPVSTYDDRKAKDICQTLIETGFVSKITYRDSVSSLLNLLLDGNNKSSESGQSN